ncbi:hypothetical protein M2J86_19320 [Citrobacter freundii]|uniref:hypothetical protein n=1 Tax=Citrobacter TaxID=544 RepID=UPI000B5AA79C|nr:MULTISPECIES: hypothetical protein [Citrobacter freundii complex]POV66903.1 hypothetical protein C3404_03930 [Citrobacter freundii complex sp. CFNIH11]ASK03125.1 hypothetical protein CFA70_25375 [Citrobacter freundii]AUZ70210.1 hypothetical protein C2U41_13050 [Citrobacter freundii complex sp. CFNIH4]EKU1544341.1 hypothetical protein [Citrobacter freundii]ELT7648249.1 hypothetical protein [Citrobacter freundii]
MRTAAIDFQVATAEEIYNALVHKITTTSALYSFQNRVGTNKRNTRKALQMLRQYKLEQRRNARYRQAIKTILKPVNPRIAAGEEVTDIFSDVINGYICLYRDRVGIALHEKQVLALILSEAREDLKKYGIDPEKHR